MEIKLQNTITTICDLDTLIYLVAYQNRDIEDVDVVIRDVDTYVNLILSTTNSTYYLGFIGGSKCFRHNIYSEYKSNRPESPDWFVKWKPIIRHRLIDKWNILVSDGREAEDDCIISANYYKDKTNVVLVHVDKDLAFWEGNHFNYQKHEFYYVDKLGYLSLNKSKLKGVGLKWQYAQLICGDGGDNIKCLKGKGPSFAYKLLNDCTTEWSLFRRTYTAYLTYCKEDNIRHYFNIQRQLICMLETPSHGFVVPSLVEVNKYIKQEDKPFEL